MKQTVFDSPIGELLITASDKAVTRIGWLKDLNQSAIMIDESPILKQAQAQLLAYFQNDVSDLELNFTEQGTAFQNKVWQSIQTIPFGETRTYTKLAKALATSPRAVGNACRANPFVILTPCHRVVSKQGIGGYDGKTNGNNIIRKQWLLAHEQNA